MSIPKVKKVKNKREELDGYCDVEDDICECECDELESGIHVSL
jgi:hypothetical protein